MTAPRTVILGWGSLLWDERQDFDNQHDPWEFDGPDVKIEFSRISQSRYGALTLVVDPKNGMACRVAYASSKRTDPEDAICDLRSREGTIQRNIGFYYANGSRCNSRDLDTFQSIEEWAKTKKFDVIVWTDLESNFEEERRGPFTVDKALAYVGALDKKGIASAVEYVRRAPDFVDTPLRRALQKQPWFLESK